MLILTRRVNETLVIDEKIEITILQARGNQVRIGIEAPREVLVHRKEILNQKQSDSSIKNNSE